MGLKTLVFAAASLLAALTGCGGGAGSPNVSGWTHHGPDDSFSSIVTVPGRPSLVYAVTQKSGGDLATLVSTDAGETWKPLVDPELSGEYRRACCFPGYASEEDVTNLTLLAVDPKRPRALYGDIEGDIFKSTDGGETWKPLNRGHRQVRGYVLAVDPRVSRTLYLASSASDFVRSDDGILRSTNGGRSWAPLPRPLKGRRIEALAGDPSNSAILYAGTESFGSSEISHEVLKSTDGGRSWRRTPLRKTTAWGDIVIDPRRPGTLYATSAPDDPGSVLKSTDSGASWRRMNVRAAGLTFTFAADLAVDPSRRDTLYLAVHRFTPTPPDESFVLKSTTGGETWKVVARLRPTGFPHGGGPTFDGLAVDPTGRRVYAGTSEGLFVCEECWRIESRPRGGSRQSGR